VHGLKICSIVAQIARGFVEVGIGSVEIGEASLFFKFLMLEVA
jgi:hypothetical protein